MIVVLTVVDSERSRERSWRFYLVLIYSEGSLSMELAGVAKNILPMVRDIPLFM